MAKIVSFKKAVKLAEELRKKGKKIVYTSGCFDILHIGHLSFLKKAKKIGGRDSVMFVGVESDDYIKKRKGKSRPIFGQKTRAMMLSSITILDFVIPFTHKNPTDEDYYNKRKQMGKHLYVFGRTEEDIVEKIKKECKKLGNKSKYIEDNYNTSTSMIEKILYKHFSS